jgi:hypothetical protein
MGTKAGSFLITPPGWRPDLRYRFVDEFRLPKETQRIEAPTPYGLGDWPNQDGRTG